MRNPVDLQYTLRQQTKGNLHHYSWICRCHLGVQVEVVSFTGEQCSVASTADA